MSAPALGKTRFEVPFQWESAEARRQHEQDLEARLPFRDLRLGRAASDGSMRHFSISGEPVFDQNGRFRGYRGVGRDVTEETQAANLLRESEARLRSLVTDVRRLVLGAGRGSALHAYGRLRRSRARPAVFAAYRQAALGLPVREHDCGRLGRA